MKGMVTEMKTDIHSILAYVFVVLFVLVMVLFVVFIVSRPVDAIETGFVVRWTMADDCDRFIMERANHPDSAWTVIASMSQEIMELWDFSIDSGLRYYYRVIAVRIDTVETDTGITYVERHSGPSNTITAMEIRFPDIVETIDDRIVEYYAGTDSMVMLVVYPDSTCTNIDVFMWDYLLFMDRVRLQCQTDAEPPPMESIEAVDYVQ